MSHARGGGYHSDDSAEPATHDEIYPVTAETSFIEESLQDPRSQDRPAGSRFVPAAGTDQIVSDVASTFTATAEPEVAQPHAGRQPKSRYIHTRFQGREPLLIGVPILDFEPPPVPKDFGAPRPDTVVDGWSSAHFAVRSSSVRGYSHRFNGVPRQDEVSVSHHGATGALVVALADGLSSDTLSQFGAICACSTAIEWLLDQLDERRHPRRFAWDELVSTAALSIVQFANEHFPGDGGATQFRTTLVAGVVVPLPRSRASAFLIGIGDSGAWVMRDEAFLPIMGSKLLGKDQVADNAVSYPLPAISPTPARALEVQFGPRDVLLLGSDGFGDPLGSGRGEVGQTFAQALSRIPSPNDFAYLLDFSRENFDDDRSLIAIWNISSR